MEPDVSDQEFIVDGYVRNTYGDAGTTQTVFSTDGWVNITTMPDGTKWIDYQRDGWYDEGFRLGPSGENQFYDGFTWFHSQSTVDSSDKHPKNDKEIKSIVFYDPSLFANDESLNVHQHTFFGDLIV